jgi:hypothetical protein
MGSEFKVFFKGRVTIMISLQASTDGLMELLYGSREPSLSFALMSAALSPLQDLTVNGNMSRLLAQFIGKRLPEKEVLYSLLHTARTDKAPAKIFKNHMVALLAIDALQAANALEKFEDVPLDYEGQCAWREELVKLIPGVGMKVISFALLIYAGPFLTQLIPIDRHHLRRLGESTEKSLSPKKYLALELAIKAERDNTGYSHLSLGLFSGMLWGQQRDGSDATIYPDHKNLSCRWY